jgi:hypothetical protein
MASSVPFGSPLISRRIVAGSACFHAWLISHGDIRIIPDLSIPALATLPVSVPNPLQVVFVL